MNPNTPIPFLAIPDTTGIRLKPVDEPLICISDSMQDTLVFQPQYFLRGIDGATNKTYVRKTVAQMLLRAAQALPAGYKLKILDAWRPPAVQKVLFDKYYASLCEKYKGTTKSKRELMEMAKLFVSYPSADPNRPFVHSTGGAVDLTLVDANGKDLNMGTAFDDFSDVAHTAHFETVPSRTVRSNRRILYHAMTAAGFTNYPSEWWHYDYGDSFWAAVKGAPAIYQGIYTEPLSTP